MCTVFDILAVLVSRWRRDTSVLYGRCGDVENEVDVCLVGDLELFEHEQWWGKRQSAAVCL